MSENLISLKQYNTFGIEVFTNELIEFSSVEDLIKSIKLYPSDEILVLGGGSNILFTKDVNETVFLNNIKGIEIITENDDTVTLRVGAGVVWHEFVLYCIENNFYGVENLSLIPGSVGASPMQNIGAYGVEVKDVIVYVEALNRKTLKVESFSNEACKFSYRESVFKRELKNQYIITHVCFELKKSATLNTSYGAIESELLKKNITKPTIKEVSDAVIAIRSSKLPNPKEIGNAGSFFKNPTIHINLLKQLKEKYHDIPSYKQNDYFFKVPAGWLIEQAGWKGKTFNNFGVHKHQALVLVNYGGATGQNIFDLSQQIIEDIQSKFNIELEREVNIY